MAAQIDQTALELWADYMLNYSFGGINRDDVVMLKGEHVAWPLMSVLQDKIFAAGAIADINIVAPDNDRGRLFGASITRHGTLEQIDRIPAWHRLRYEAMTKYIEILGSESPELFSNLPDQTASALIRADEQFKNIRLLKPWLLTLYPTQAFADMEGLSLEEYTGIIVGASTVNPAMLDQIEENIYSAMNASNGIRIETLGPGSDRTLTLQMSIEGRKVIKCTGKRNFPDGEVFTSPNASSVEGEIFVDLPVFYNGTTIQGIYLRFEKGIIKEYTAQAGFDTLRRIIETDDGSHRLGEVALGMNAGIATVLRHPLFVEKVGGTLHIAIGASYPETFVDDPGSVEGMKKADIFFNDGMLNRSAQHVDIVTDFRTGGAGKAVYLDQQKLRVQDNIWVVEP